jgi:membrane associated rhomboid family serine protease
MIIPVGTDAPVYHWPFATLGTIIVNSAIHVGLMSVGSDAAEPIYDWLMLRYGWWNPLQWLTTNYLHADLFHLIGNMIVLWGLGLIVEGKVGWWRFLLIYNGIGLLSCSVEQTLMIFVSEGGSLGASRCIYGLLAIAMLWAPRNDFRCLAMFGWYVFVFDWSVLNYTIFSLFLQFVLAIWNVMLLSAITGSLFVSMTSEILHLMGAACGAAVGLVMLNRGWVDCENWDLFSVLKDRHLKTREELAEEALNSEEGKAKLAAHREQLLAQFRNFLAAGEAAAAMSVHRRAGVQFGASWQVSEEELVQLITGLRKAQRWDDAVLVMAEYLRSHTTRAPAVRLALAQVLVEHLSRPRQALRVLIKLDQKSLSPQQQGSLAKLQARAQQAAEEDPFEAVQDDI